MIGLDVDGAGPVNAYVKEGLYYTQQVNVLEVPSTPGVKLIPWMNYTDNKWNRTTVRNMIYDFEAKNPEWHVIAAINGDGFDVSKLLPFMEQSNGVTIGLGEFYKSKSSGPGVMSFIRDGRQNENALAYMSQSQANNSLITIIDVYDENDNPISRHSVNKHNAAPNLGETSVYYGTFSNEPAPYTFNPKEVDSSASFYGVANAEIWLPNDTDGDFYGKGVISTTDKNSLATLEKEQFAICTTNEALKAALAVGVKVRVQRVYSGSYANVDNAISVFMNRILYNDVADGLFHTNIRHPRAFIGVKPDGTLCLIVVNGRDGNNGKHGLNSYEMAAVLRRYSCVRGYNLDGGGSSTLLIRDEEGNIIVKNIPCDGGERRDSNCLFVAVRKPKINVTAKAETRKLSLRVNIEENLDHDINKLYVTLNNEKKEVVEGVVTFDRLQPGTEYEYQLSYEDSHGINVVTDLKGFKQTNFNKPELKGIVCVETNNSFDFTINYRDPSNVSNFGVAPLIVNGHEYQFVEGSVSVLKNEVGNVIETCSVELEYQVNSTHTYNRMLNNVHLPFALVFENMYANVEV